MHNVLLMAVVNSTKYLFHNDSCISFGVVRTFNNLIKKFSSCAHFSDDKVPLVILIDLVESDDVRMVLKYLTFLTIFFRISISCMRRAYSVSLRKVFLMIFTDLLTPVFLWVATQTSPKAPEC
jgi:hypothetical protein